MIVIPPAEDEQRPGSNPGGGTPAGTKRPRKAIGFGAFEYEQESSRSEARQLFLDAVRSSAPNALAALEGTPYQNYQRLAQQAAGISLYSLTHESIATVEPHLDEPLLVAYRALRQSLEEWSVRWNLNADWCRDWALRTLYRWGEEDAAAGGEETEYTRIMAALGTPSDLGVQIERPRHWAGGSGGFTRPFREEELNYHFTKHDSGEPPLVQGAFDFTLREAHITLQFTHPFWNPLYGPPDDMATAIAALCADAVQHYIEEIKQRAAARGLAAIPTKNPEYFEWLAEFQVAGASYRDIADDSGVSRTAVTKGIKDVAAMIELPLRAPAPPYRRY